MQIALHVDADACPVKDEIYKVAARYALTVYVVANAHMSLPRRPGIELVTVRGGFNAADDWIAEHALANDIVITDDLPLADRAVKRGAHVLTPRGRRLDEDTICDALATRNLLEGIREAGGATRGPKGFSEKDRSQFLSRLDDLVNETKRRRPQAR